MSKINHLHEWQDSLYFRLDIARNCDLNRLLYLHCPSTKALQAGKKQAFAQRTALITQLKSHFNRTISEGGSHAQLLNLYYVALEFLKWSDMHNEKAFTKASLEYYCEYLLGRAYRKEIKNTSYSKTRSHLASLFQALDLPKQWFESVPSLPKNDIEPFEAYSNSDLKQLLPLLRALFKQTSEQFLANPLQHMEAKKNRHTMTFEYKRQTYKLGGAINKMMAAATYLLSYYTYSNTSVLLSLQHPQKAGSSIQESWHTMPAFKRRAFKVVHIEMGENSINIPKYSMQFFNTLLEVSKVIDDSSNALLLQTCLDNQVSPVSHHLLSGFCRLWLKKHFKLTDQRGRELRPRISRFRKTGSQLASYYQGDIAQGILLDTTPSVRKKHYSTGNHHDNQSMTQETVLIRQEQAIRKTSPRDAQNALNIEVLTIDESLRVNIPVSRTANGGSCKDPFGEKSKSYNYKTNQHHLSQGEKLACADLLKCFGCPNQVIVQSVEDIWCLLSFKECIEESLYLHLDANHYKRNFSEVVDFIENNILPRISKRVRQQAETQLDKTGRHSLWQEAESVIPLAKVPIEGAL
ncbi:hypothetical protein ACPV34_06745 [Photobacterium damselae]|uniref:hypothetical protein n=1 Tax=Photobacterium damselae TaxID=38293 RepID=UPI00406985C7